MSNGEPPLLTNTDIANYPDPMADDPRTLTNEDLGAGIEDVAAPDQGMVEIDQPYYPPDLEVPSDVEAERRSKSLYELASQALADGDRLLATGYLNTQREELAMSWMRVQNAGGDPGRIVAPNAKWTDPSIVEQQQQILMMDRLAKLRSVFETHNVQEFELYQQGIEKDYREKNGAAAVKLTKDMTRDQHIEYLASLQPVVRDPNEIAELRQRLVQMDKAMKEIHPSLSVYTHPRTQKFANWIAREATSQSAGYLASGEQKMELGEGQSGAAPITMAFAEGVTDFGLNLIYGAMEYSGRGIESMTGGVFGWTRPQNYIEGSDGKLYVNAGKVPGVVETIAAVRAAAYGENIQQYVGRVNAARGYMDQQANGFDKVVRGTAAVIGMGWGFGLPAGAAMGTGKALMVGGRLGAAPGAKLFGRYSLPGANFGGLVDGGLKRLATGSWGPFAIGGVGGKMLRSERMTKITRIMAATAGAAAANGMLEGVAFGNQEGFGKAYAHGMAMAPVLMFFGAIGRKTEQAMLYRKVDGKLVPRRHMPEKVAAMVSGGLEGVGFGTLEAHQTGALWGFIHDPNMETWQIYVKNVVGFMLFKAAAGHGFIENPAEAAVRQIARRQAVEHFGEEVTTRREAEAKGPEKVDLRDLGQRDPEGREIKGVQPSAEELMEQASRGELQEPETITHREAREARGKVEGEAEQQGRDPLEDPDFMSRPENERRKIMEAGTPIERRKVAEEFEGPERREGERRAAEEQEIEARRADTFEERVEEAARYGISEELLTTVGEASRALREALTPEAAEAARERLDRAHREIEAIEARQEPVTEAKMRELEAEGLIEAEDLQAPGRRPGLSAGKAPGGSSGPAANPYRNLEHVPGTKPIRASDIEATFEGRQGVAGIRIPFTPWRIGKTLGTAVQVAMKTGRIAERATLGVFKLFENMTRTKAGLDLVVNAHEWSHVLMRQQLFGEGGGGRSFVKQAREWMKSLPPEAQADIAKILNWYPGANEGKLRQWQMGAEGWAEWFARDLLGDETLYAEVPHLSKWMLEWLGAPEQANLARGPQSQYRQLQSQLKRYNLQGSAARVRSMQQKEAQPPEPQGSWYERQSAGLRSAIDKVTKAFYDDMNALKRSQAKWLEISDIKPWELDILDNPARLFDALRMVATKQTENFLLRGTHTLGFKRKGESLQKILRSEGVKGRVSEFIDYVVSVRALNLSRKGKTQALPDADFVQTIKELETPQFIEAAKRLKTWSDALLDLVGEAGNVAPADIRRMKDYSIVYIPFVRALRGPKPSMGGRGVGEKGTGLKRTKGATEEIQDPVKALEEVTRSMITKAHQSMVMKALYKMTLKAEVGGLATIVPKKKVPHQYRIDQAFRKIQEKVKEELPEFEGEETILKEGERGELTADEIELWKETFDMMGELLTETGISDSLITLFGQKSIPYNEADAIVAYTPRLTPEEIAALPKDRQGVALQQNNKMQWMELDVPAYEALMGIDQPTGPTFLDLPIIKQIIGYPVKATRFFATDANPAFVAANMLRDAMSQPVFDPEGKFRPFAGFYKMIRGGAELLSGSEYAQMYEASGAGVSSFFNEGVKRELRGEARSVVGSAYQTVAKAVDTWKRWMAKPESFLRIYEFRKIYDQAKEAGKSDTESAFLALEAAREITVNFARGGIVSRALNQMIPYFNASFQGQRKMIRSLRGVEGTTDADKARIQRMAFANGIVNITVPSLVLWAMVKDEDWYKDLPVWRKRFYHNFKLGDDGPIISLPRNFELGLLFGTLPEIWADTAADANPIAIAPTFGEMALPYLRGLGSMIPAFARPLIEQETGYDFFSQRALTPYWTTRTQPPEEQVRQSTSETAKWMFKEFRGIVELTGANNPIELEHLLGGYTAGAGVTGLRMIDEMFDLKEHPGIQEGILAPLSSFYNRFGRQTAHGSSRTVQDLFDMGDKMQANKRNLDRMEQGTLSRINSAKERIGQLRRAANEGRISREQADRQSFEIANRIMQTVR